MSDPRYTDPMSDPSRPGSRDPDAPGRLDLENDGSRSSMWAWVVGIIAVIVVAMLVYDYNRPISTTASNPPVSSPSTTGAAPAPAPRANPLPSTPPQSAPAPAPATPVPNDNPR
jgi:hypothetical protein